MFYDPICKFLICFWFLTSDKELVPTLSQLKFLLKELEIFNLHLKIPCVFTEEGRDGKRSALGTALKLLLGTPTFDIRGPDDSPGSSIYTPASRYGAPG